MNEIFFSFAEEDNRYYQDIQKHLSPWLQQQGLQCWSHQSLLAGADKREIQSHLERASAIVLLLSANYFFSDACMADGLKALNLQRKQKSVLIPVLLSPCDYTSTPFGKLQALPTNKMPVSLWKRADQAYVDIVKGIRNAYQAISARDTPKTHNQLWVVPHLRNPHFTGRETELQAIEQALKARQNITCIQSISGLGGIGKTQIALEYAYRHRHEYRYVFWVLADTYDTLDADYGKLAEKLNLSTPGEAEQGYVVEAVKNWLEENSDWLLILDNADELSVIQDFLPHSTAPGQILLTTRAQAVSSLGPKIELSDLQDDAGALFLLRRCGLLHQDFAAVSPQDRQAAREIVRELGGLPLALDQAGAYVEETACSLQSYLELYQQHRISLLKKRGGQGQHHPAPVATTWQLAFERVKQANFLAETILRLCAFLAPDDIPEEILTQGKSAFRLKFEDAMGTLQKYSLITRNTTEKTLVVHRLIQAVLRSSLTKEEQKRWSEAAVKAVKNVFPRPDMSNQGRCRRLLPHAQECKKWILQEPLNSLEGADLLFNMGHYLRDHAEKEELAENSEEERTLENSGDKAKPTQKMSYRESQALFKKALAIKQTILGAEHPATVECINAIAATYRLQGAYQEVEKWYTLALEIRRKMLGPENPDTVISMSNLANAYRLCKKYEEAEAFYVQALRIQQRKGEQLHANSASILNGLATLYRVKNEVQEAETLYRGALEIRSKVLGKEHLDTAASLNNLGLVFEMQHKYAEAEAYFAQALEIRRRFLPSRHPDLLLSQNNLGKLYRSLGKYQEADNLYREVLDVQQRTLGKYHFNTQATIKALIEISQAQKKYAEAEDWYRYLAELQDASPGEQASTLDGLARLYLMQKRYGEAEKTYMEAIAIWQKAPNGKKKQAGMAASRRNLAQLKTERAAKK